MQNKLLLLFAYLASFAVVSPASGEVSYDRTIPQVAFAAQEIEAALQESRKAMG